MQLSFKSLLTLEVRLIYVLFAFVTVIAILLSLTFAAIAETKKNYRAVGFNDGTIHARFAVISAIAAQSQIAPCAVLDPKEEGIVFIEVKSERIKLIKSVDKKSLKFCSG